MQPFKDILHTYWGRGVFAAGFGLAPPDGVHLIQHALRSCVQLAVGGQGERRVVKSPVSHGRTQRVRSHHLPSAAPSFSEE